jgi:hypothetical protein
MKKFVTRRLYACVVFFCCSSLWVATALAQEDISSRWTKLRTDSVFSLLPDGVAVDRWSSEPFSSPFCELTNAESAFAIDNSPILQVAFQQDAAAASGSSGINSGETGGGGAGAGAATDPSVPLTQFQIQNVFTPETYDATGYSNTTILQPVLSLDISKNAFFPFHVVRPTLPIIAPTADPDGPRGVHGGLGDLALLDVYVRPLKEIKSSIGFGYAATFPTSTHPALGRGEWEFGPAFAFITQAVEKWNIGFLYEQPFSLESNAYQVLFQPVVVRTLPDEWYVGWGDLLMKLDDENGGYDLPISGRVGKVVKWRETPVNIFVQPSYTPEGLRSGPGGAVWSVKLNVTFLFPGADLKAPILHRLYH